MATHHHAAEPTPPVGPCCSRNQRAARLDTVVRCPLRITDFLWQKTDDGTARSQDGLHMRARDLLRIGQLYLDGGRWNDEPTVTREWINASFKDWTSTDSGFARYGFQWWTYPLERPGPTVDSERCPELALWNYVLRALNGG